MEHVHLDMLGKDAERHLDRAGRAGRVEQRAEYGLADLAVTLAGERRLGQAAPDEIAYVRDRRRPRGEDLREHDDGHYLDRVVAGSLGGLSQRSLPQPPAASSATPGRFPSAVPRHCLCSTKNAAAS